MNRTDFLTDRLIDGTLTEAEAAELVATLAADPSARAGHVALLRLELSLRGLRTEFDLAASTVAQIEAARVERTTAAVMTRLVGRPVRARRPWVRGVAWASVAAAALVAVWVGTRPPTSPPPTPGPGPARLVALTGAVEVIGPGGSALARLDQAVTSEQSVRVGGDESRAVLEFPDGVRVELHPDTTVRLDPVAGVDPRVVLIEGWVTAIADERPVVVGTGTLEVEATHGAFALWSAGSGSARVEPQGGDVRVRRGAEDDPGLALRGKAAFVRDDGTPTRIEAPLAPQTVPLARLDFMALDAGFTQDGDVIAVSAKQWTRWKPGAPDPGRTLFAPKVFNDGITAWLTPDRRFVALCRTDDREERVAIRSLPSGEEVASLPVKATEPRFLCISPDASWVATAVGPKPLNRKVRVWNTATGDVRFVGEVADAVFALAASPDGKWLAVGLANLARGSNNGVVVFDAATGDRRFELPTNKKGVTSLAFSPDGKSLAVGFNGAVEVWDVRERKRVQAIEGFERNVTSTAFDPKTTVVAAGTRDGQVWVWSVATGRRRQVVETGVRGVRSVAFSPDGKQLVTTTNRAVTAVWAVATESNEAPDF